MVWGKAGSTTLTSAGELTDITLTANTSLTLINHNIGLSANNDIDINFNNDTATNYADRFSRNGGAENTSTSNGSPRIISSGGAFDSFVIGYIVNISSEEKLMIIHGMQSGGTGAGNVPDRRNEGVLKWANTSAQITEIDITTSSTATMASDSNASVLGSEITPAATIPFVANAQVGSRAEITDTRKMYYYENGLEYEDNFSSDGDWVFTTSNASITGGVLQCTQYRSANDSATTSVGTSIGTKFLQQFEYEVDSYPSSNGSNAWYGLWSLPNTTGANTGGQDFVVLLNNDGVNHKISVGQNTSAYGGTGSTGSTWIVLTVGTKYYIELIGNGDDTYTLNIRTVSHTGSHVTNSPQTVTKTGLSNLQYFGFKNTTGGGNGGTVTKTDDLKIYKGTTTTGNTWKEIGT